MANEDKSSVRKKQEEQILKVAVPGSSSIRTGSGTSKEDLNKFYPRKEEKDKTE